MSTPWQRRAVFLGGAAALVGAFQAGPAAYRRYVTGITFEPISHRLAISTARIADC